VSEPSARGPTVFLSLPSVLSSEQGVYLDEWSSWLAAQSVAVRRLPRSDYSEAPWIAVCRAISQASGVLILGFEQLDARGSVWRPETSEEMTVESAWTSPWLQLEAGIAIALGIPVLAACERTVGEGVFDPRIWGGPVTGTSLDEPDERRDVWLDQVQRVALSSRGGSRARPS
jgi:hypothetical protein